MMGSGKKGSRTTRVTQGLLPIPSASTPLSLDPSPPSSLPPRPLSVFDLLTEVAKAIESESSVVSVASFCKKINTQHMR